MRTLSKIVWATVGVGSIGALVGIGLMMAGDWLGRRDEAALRAVIPAPVAVTSPAHLPIPGPATEAIVAVEPPLNVADMLATFQRGVSSPTGATLAQAAEAITVVSDEERVVDRQQVLEATDGQPFQLVLSQTKFIPHLDGAQSGLRVASVTDSPWAKKAGLEVGDVLTAVNGRPILDPLQMGEIAGELLNASDVAVTVQRAGQEVNLQYHMKGSPAQAPLSSPNP